MNTFDNPYRRTIESSVRLFHFQRLMLRASVRLAPLKRDTKMDEFDRYRAEMNDRLPGGDLQNKKRLKNSDLRLASALVRRRVA